jgi:hypothetical protein
MQIRKKWLNQLKKILNKHLNEYYLASFCWRIFSSNNVSLKTEENYWMEE